VFFFQHLRRLREERAADSGPVDAKLERYFAEELPEANRNLIHEVISDERSTPLSAEEAAARLATDS
jgi:hypothetical protein